MPTLTKTKTKRITASVTELTSFQTCRRRWYLSRLYTGKTQGPALIFGSAIHAGLELYFNAKKQVPNNPLLLKASILAGYIEYCEKMKKNESKEYGMLWEFAAPAFDDLFELGRKILINYIDFDMDADTPFKPVLVEKRIYLPLDARNKNILTMRWDAMGITYNDLTAIMDHKTTSGGIISRGATLDLDEQMTGYAYGYWRIHQREKLINFIIYDTISKKIPAPIKVLKSGKLSTDKSQDTILPILYATIADYKDDPDRFFELVNVLEEKGWSSYFRREASPRNQHQLEQYEDRVGIIFEEMRAAIENPRLAYPSPGPIKCPSCPFLQVCTAMEDGSDYQYLLDQAFVRHGKTAYTLPPRFTEMTG